MNKKMKSLLFGLGSLAAVAAPVVAVVACGKEDSKPSAGTPAVVAKGDYSDMWAKVFKTNPEVKVGTSLVLPLRHGSLNLSLPVTAANDGELMALSRSKNQAGLVTRLGQLFFATATDAQKQQGLTEVEVSGTIEYFITGVMPSGANTGQHNHTTGSTTGQTTSSALPALVAPTAHALTDANTIDLSNGMDSWHKVMGANAATQIADGTKVGFISTSNGLAYETSFNKSVVDKLKAMINATTVAQEKDFVIVLAAAVAGTMDELHIKAALSDAAAVAIIKTEFDALVGKASGTHSTTVSHFDAIKAELIAMIK